MRISFAKTTAEFNPTIINKEAIEVVTSVKLLKWNCHINEISRKVSTRLYFLKQLKRVGVASKGLITFFII